MIFRNLAHIPDEEIQTSGDTILKECTEAALDTYLLDWTPWIRHLRRTSLPTYDSLTPTEGTDNTCCLRNEISPRPVLYADNVYDYDAFATTYIDKGTDPFTRLPIDLSQLKRVIAPN